MFGGLVIFRTRGKTFVQRLLHLIQQKCVAANFLLPSGKQKLYFNRKIELEIQKNNFV